MISVLRRRTDNGVLEPLMNYIDDPSDRAVISSEICREWYYFDSKTRKHVTVPLYCTTTPERFPNLVVSLKLKGAPRIVKFATPWIKMIKKYNNCLKSLHFKRMIFSDDDDLFTLANKRRHTLSSLKLQHCSGFTKEGLEYICCSCKKLTWSMDIIEDRGLIELGRCCNKLKRLRIGTDGEQRVGEDNMVTQRGLNAIADGCPELEYMSVDVSNITNESLQHIGNRLKKLHDFRLTLLDNREEKPNFPLDVGVRELLKGCEKLRRFALYLKSRGLTDEGLRNIGEHGGNLKWILLGCCGQSDIGLLNLCQGCRSLEKFEIRGCKFFSEEALAYVATELGDLKKDL